MPDTRSAGAGAKPRLSALIFLMILPIDHAALRMVT